MVYGLWFSYKLTRTSQLQMNIKKNGNNKTSKY